MYSSSTYNPPLTNNPFIENTSDPNNRYPDLSQQWQPQYQNDIYQQPHPPVQQQQISSPYAQQPSLFQVPQQLPQIPLSHPPSQIQLSHPPPQPLTHPSPNYPSPYQQPSSQQGPPPSTSFKPSSSFGQTLTSSISGGGPYGYLQSGQPPLQQQQTSGPVYNPAQQQLNNPNYVAQLDPFGRIPQAWDATTSQSQQPVKSTDLSTFEKRDPLQSQQPTNNNFEFGKTTNRTPQSQQPTSNNFEYGNTTNRNNQNNSFGFSPSGDPHPRDYIRSHKQEIEDWDSYTWKQLLNSCEALKNSWESKRNELKTKLAGLQSQHRYAGYYDRTQIQHQGGIIQAVS